MKIVVSLFDARDRLIASETVEASFQQGENGSELVFPVVDFPIHSNIGGAYVSIRDEQSEGIEMFIPLRYALFKDETVTVSGPLQLCD